MLLSAGKLGFTYADRRSSRARSARVIDDLSLDIRAGDVVGILGPNGSGKTTLLKLLSGALTPQSGVVRFDGSDIGALNRRAVARRIAVVPQETSLAFDYSVLDMVLMGRYPHLGAFEVEGPDDLAAAARALERTGTRAFASRLFTTLSGGEKQRVVIASALAQLDTVGSHDQPRVLVLDEPTASLDLKYQHEIATVVRRLHDDTGLTVVVSTHDLRFAASVCNRIVMLREGRILADGPPATVLTPANISAVFDVPVDFTGPTGPPGPTGPTGPAGPAGPTLPPVLQTR